MSEQPVIKTRLVRSFLRIGIEQETEKALRDIDPADVVAITMSKSGVGFLGAYHALIVYRA